MVTNVIEKTEIKDDPKNRVARDSDVKEEEVEEFEVEETLDN